MADNIRTIVWESYASPNIKEKTMNEIINDEINENAAGRIIFNIDVMLAKRKMSVTELANKVGITLANMSILKTGKAKAIKISTLIRICDALDCQPGDILEYKNENE